MTRVASCARRAAQPVGRPGFTLIELLVVVAIIALLISILLPSLRAARWQARCTVDLTSLRSLEQAQHMYFNDWGGALIDVGLAHGSGVGLDADVSWIKTLESIYKQPLLRRSPIDDSPHWSPEDGGQGTPVPGLTGAFPYRRTSYGVNNIVCESGAPFDPALGRKREWFHIERIPRPATTVHFLFMAKTGEFAGADHPHAENWEVNPSLWTAAPRIASGQVQTNAVAGPPGDVASEANYAFLDGHAARKRFDDVWRRRNDNNFFPDVSY